MSDDTASSASRRKKPASSSGSREGTGAPEQADEGSAIEPGAPDERPSATAPRPDPEELERLRARLLAQHHGRRR